MSEPKIDDLNEIAEMNRRHCKAAMLMQELALVGLAELRRRGELTIEECKQLLAEGLHLERAAAPGGSRKRH